MNFDSSFQITPGEIRRHAHETAEEFSLAVSRIQSLSSHESTCPEALELWYQSSVQLFKNIYTLHEYAQSNGLVQMAAYEALDNLQPVIAELIFVNKLPRTLTVCAQSSLNEFDFLKFESQLDRYYSQLFTYLNPEYSSPFTVDDSMHCHILLCGGQADIVVKGDTEGNASIGGNIQVSHESDSGVKYSVEASLSIEKDSSGQTSGKGEVRAGVNWDH